MDVAYDLGPTPIGFAFVATTDRGVRALGFFDGDDPAPALHWLGGLGTVSNAFRDPAAVGPILGRIRAYFDASAPLDDLPLDLTGTPFQLRVWEALRSIPAGSTRTYGRIASDLGSPGAARAVGAACGANPVSLLVPCHRAVGSGGSLHGYAWGLDRKRALLETERAATGLPFHVEPIANAG